MIEEKFVGNNQSIRFAAIEAILETKGWITSKDISEIFGMHRCNAAKIINRYIVYANPKVDYSSTDKRYIPLEGFERAVLKQTTNAVAYLRVLHAIHGVPYEDA